MFTHACNTSIHTYTQYTNLRVPMLAYTSRCLHAHKAHTCRTHTAHMHPQSQRTCAHLHACECIYTRIPLHMGPYAHTLACMLYMHTCYMYIHFILCMRARASPEVGRISCVSAAERLLELSTAKGAHLHLPTRQSPVTLWEAASGRWGWRQWLERNTLSQSLAVKR